MFCVSIEFDDYLLNDFRFLGYLKSAVKDIVCWLEGPILRFCGKYDRQPPCIKTETRESQLQVLRSLGDILFFSIFISYHPTEK
jgi:hypothetical protein